MAFVFSVILAVGRYLVVERHEWDFNHDLRDASAAHYLWGQLGSGRDVPR